MQTLPSTSVRGGNGKLNVAENGTQTVLGEDRNNPFTPTQLQEACEAVYPGENCQYPTTHHYVKLEPQSFEDILTIENADIEYFDFPLTREVIELGDYYQNPLEGEFPTFYAVVPEDFIFPDVPYTLLSDLHLNLDNDPLVLAQAFKQTDNADHIYNDVVPEGGFVPDDYEDFI